MRIDVTQQLRLQQQMKLSPRIIQAMEILQLPMQALQERIDEEMESNPVLEVYAPEADDQAPPAKVDTGEERGEHDMVVSEDNGNSEDFERLAEFTDEYGAQFAAADSPVRPPSPPPGERDRKLDAMANAPAPGESLDEYLLHQWAFVEVGEAVKAAGELIINHIDDDGYLRVPLEDLPARAGEADEAPTPVALSEALQLIQTLEPVGVGARDLKECLTLQLQAEAQAGRDVSLEMMLVSRFLRDIELNRLPQIARRSGKDIEQVKGAIENLSHLNPRPGLLVGHRTVPVISPGILVDVDENDRVVITMADGNAPRLYISKSYRKLARNRQTDQQARRFLRKNIRSAQWLIDAIAQRRQTVRRVAEEVFGVQRDFLHRGQEALKPLPMADIAAKVGVHVATVSRAVAGKYVQTPRGIFPLRMFFSGGTTTTEGQDVAWDAVRVKLQEVIDSEDKFKPLNDDKLVEALRAKGLSIARRTVAKYRKLLNIPSARKRRRF
ncbi:MAG: RNA polymerase factor sigma-54 [Phycisphaerae bacterium]|jgi:RNA polymerase sigma-54 factor|nr:RNA polymerase factor sigma-54 [Phycisphaerae bacterium]